jgi:lysozyme
LAKRKQNINPTNSRIAEYFLIIIAFLFVGLIIYQQLINKNKHFKMFKEFGIEMPTNYTIHGIDVSHHNGLINWQAVKNMNVKGIQISFAFIKATEGSSYIDNKFEYNWLQAKKTNIVRGAYHYFNENASGEVQAQHFIKTVGPLLPGDLPPVLDIEENKVWTKEKLNSEAMIFVNELFKFYHVKPIVYTYVNFYSEKLFNQFDDYHFWAAHYERKTAPDTKRNWTIWQHSEKGQVSGINEKVDFNVFNGDIYKFNQLLK